MSKFSAILAAKNATQSEDVPAEEESAKDVSKSVKNAASHRVQPAAKPVELPEAPVATRKRGRPAAKRSDPKFVQTTAYIRKETLRQVKKELLELQGAEERDFSELVEELLVKWLGK